MTLIHRNILRALLLLALLLSAGACRLLPGRGLSAGEPYPAPWGTLPPGPTAEPLAYPEPGAAPSAPAPPAPAPSATAEGYPAAPTAAPAVPAGPGEARGYPADTRTGIAGVDAVISAALAGDQETLQRMARYLLTACTTAQGAGGPPKCAQGERNGSLVEVFPLLGEEGEYVRRANIAYAFDLPVSALYAVYQPPAEAGDPAWPQGDYAVVFIGSGTHTSITLFVEDNAVVRVNRLRAAPEAEVAAALAAGASLVLPPWGSSQQAYPAQ